MTAHGVDDLPNTPDVVQCSKCPETLVVSTWAEFKKSGWYITNIQVDRDSQEATYETTCPDCLYK